MVTPSENGMLVHKHFVMVNYKDFCNKDKARLGVFYEYCDMLTFVDSFIEYRGRSV